MHMSVCLCVCVLEGLLKLKPGITFSVPVLVIIPNKTQYLCFLTLMMILLPAVINETESRSIQITTPQHRFKQVSCPTQLFEESGIHEAVPEGIR